MSIACSTCHDNAHAFAPGVCPDCHGHPFTSCEDAGCFYDADLPVPKFRPCWLYTLEYTNRLPSTTFDGVRLVEHRSETSARPEDKEAKLLGMWRTDERVLDDAELREWIEMQPAGLRQLADMKLEIVRSRTVPMP